MSAYTPAAAPSVYTSERQNALRALVALLATLVLSELVGLLGIQVVPHKFVYKLWQHPFVAAATAGAIPLLFALRLPRRLVVGTVATGLGLAGLGCVIAGGPSLPAFLLGPSIPALAMLVWLSVRGAPELREHARLRLYEAIVLACFLPATLYIQGFSTTLHPTVLDVRTLIAEMAYGFMPGPSAMHLFAAVPWFAMVCTGVYVALPLCFALAIALRAWRGTTNGVSSLTAFIMVGIFGFIGYMLFPVVGPKQVFGDAYHQGGIVLEELLRQPVAIREKSFEMRNCMPSLHTAWALMAFWLTRGHGRKVRALFAVFFILTELATLGLGFHYTVDLVVALPFTLAILAACTRVAPEGREMRRNLVVVGAVLVVAWLALLRFAPQALLVSPVLPWLATALTAAFAFWGEWKLSQLPKLERVTVTEAAPARDALPARQAWAVGALAFASGLAALCYALVIARPLTLALGGFTRAGIVVLATVLGGLALGTWQGGRVGSRVKNAVRAFALAELGIAAACGVSPVLLAQVQTLYAQLARDSGRAPLLMQGLFAALLTVPPAVLLGMSRSFLARHLTDAKQTPGRAVGLIQGLGLSGAAAGAMLTGYVLLPALGTAGTTWLTVALHGLIGLAGLGLSRSVLAPVEAAPVASGASAPLLGQGVLAVGGFVAVAMGTVYFHLLFIVAGHSVYALPLMAFALLAGLASGALVSRRWFSGSGKAVERLGLLALLLAVTLLADTFLWNVVPRYFSGFDNFKPVSTFAEHEFVRLSVCGLALLLPSFLLGAGYPLALECAAPGRVDAMSRASALGAVGGLLGASGGWLLIDGLGAPRAVLVLSVLCLAVALAALLASGTWRAPVPLVAGLAALLLLGAQPAALDVQALSTGTHTAFREQRWGTVVDSEERAEDGLTTVAESRGEDGTRVLTLLTHGGYQGGDSAQRDVTAAAALSLLPLLHAPERGEAAILGLGTGVAARVAADAGFRRLDVVERSGSAVRMARKHFAGINGGVLEWAQVQTHVADGRDFLQRSSRGYSFIGMEASSPWSSDAAHLYNRELYAAARFSLSERGVLQQSLPLSRLTQDDVRSIIGTARSVFPQVWLYAVGSQGVLVACAWECAPDAGTLALIDGAPALKDARELLGAKSAMDLLQQRVLAPEAVDRLLASAEAPVSTDDRPVVAHLTPRSSYRPHDASLQENLEALRKFQPESVYAGTRLSPAVSQQGTP